MANGEIMYQKGRAYFTNKTRLYTKDNGIIAIKVMECYFMKVGIAFKALL
jgi:hypothetical protein